MLVFGVKFRIPYVKLNLNLQINTVPLPFVDVKNVGIYVDARLWFGDHVNNVLKKSYASLQENDLGHHWFYLISIFVILSMVLAY